MFLWTQKLFTHLTVGITNGPSKSARLNQINRMKKEFYRGGRPETPKEQRSDIIVKVRFNQAEYNRLVIRKSTTLSPDLSKFIRSVCLEKPLLIKTQMETYQDIALSLIREMRSDILRIGVNINQSSRRINSTTDYRDLQRDVSEMVNNMSQLDAQLRTLMSAVYRDGQTLTPELAQHGHPDQ